MGGEGLGETSKLTLKTNTLETTVKGVEEEILRAVESMRVWQGVAMDSLKFHPGLPCPILLRPADEPSLKRPYGRSRVGPALPLRTPHAVRLWWKVAGL
jgi:hypothetical protein